MTLISALSDAIKGAGFSNYNMSPLPHTPSFVTQDGELEIFSCHAQFYPEHHTATIHNFDVHDPFKGKKLAPLALKTISLHALSQGVKEIEILLVRHDGLTFWPRYGAVPQELPSQRSYLAPFMEEEFLHSDGERLTSAFELAGNSLEDAWLYLTDPKTNSSRDLIRRLNSRSYDRTMYLNLEHSAVQERLGLDNF